MLGSRDPHNDDGEARMTFVTHPAAGINEAGVMKARRIGSENSHPLLQGQLGLRSPTTTQSRSAVVRRAISIAHFLRANIMRTSLLLFVDRPRVKL